MSKAHTKPQGTTSYKDTAFGIIPRSELLKLEIEGTKKGLESLRNINTYNNKSIPISPDLICKLHEVSFAWIFPQWAGKYRKIQVTFSNKEAPPYFKAPELIINLCNDLTERLKHLPERQEESFILEVVSLLAWFQHRFVFIHPFQDYNGRTARMLTIFILLNLDLPAIELKAEKEDDRKTYLIAMQRADEGDYSLLEKLIGDELTKELTLYPK